MVEGNYGVDKWWDDSTVAVVTGANKGIGFEIARILSSQGFKTILTSRNEQLGQKAVKKLPNVEYLQLDITDASSVKRCAAALQEKYGKVDVLINNAGIAYKGSTFGADEATTTIKCNVKGTRRVSEAILPLMTNGGRIVNLCSRAGMLRQLRSKDLVDAFQKPESADAVVELADSFVAAIREGNHQEKGWSNSMYGVSKIAEMSYTRWLAGSVKDQGIAVYGMCPGYCVTDMTSGGGNKTAAEGADTAVWLALQPIGSIRAGEMYGERSIVPW